MGCAASSPEGVIGPAITENNRADMNAGYKTFDNGDTLSINANINNHEREFSENADFETNSYFKELERSGETLILKADAPKFDSPNGSSDNFSTNLDHKKGFVAFEINLNGKVEPTLDSTIHPLPKRLKHLEPLEGATKLTAEELNEKLEKAEQIRLQEMAKRKNGVSRRSSCTMQCGSRQSLQENNSPINVDGNDNADTSECMGSHKDISLSLNFLKSTLRNSQNELDEQEMNFILSNSNNNAEEFAKDETLVMMRNRATLQLNVQMLNGARKPLNAFAELDRRKAE